MITKKIRKVFWREESHSEHSEVVSKGEVSLEVIQETEVKLDAPI